MALNNWKYSLSRVSKVKGIQRRLSTQTATATNESHVPEVNCTVLSNKIMVSSLDHCGGLSRVSVSFRTGPRHETTKNLGIVHVIRSLTGFASEKCTGFAIWKNTQYNGVHMYCTGDREVTGFHLVGVRTKIKDVLKFLSATAATPAFKRWEVKDNLARLRYEINGLSPKVKVIENLHSAAFRTGLGNSLFIKSDNVGIHTSEMLEKFYKEGFTSNRATVSGYNVYHNELIEFAQTLELCANDIPEGNSKYFGGEIRHNKRSCFSHIAVATEGVGSKNIKDALTYCVLQYVYGVHPMVSWGGSPSPLYKAICDAAPKAAISSFNVSYSDNGLFGFIISSYAEDAGKALEEGFKVLKSGLISEKDFKRAKTLVKTKLLYSSENSENLLDDIIHQSLLGGVIIPAAVLAEALEKITLSDVSNTAKKVACGKFSLSAYGNLNGVPYLSDLV